MKVLGMKQISMNIPMEAYNNVFLKRWHHNEIYMLGYQSKQENPQLLERLRESEAKIEKLARTLEFFARKSTELEEKLSNLRTVQK